MYIRSVVPNWYLSHLNGVREIRQIRCCDTYADRIKPAATRGSLLPRERWFPPKTCVYVRVFTTTTTPYSYIKHASEPRIVGEICTDTARTVTSRAERSVAANVPKHPPGRVESLRRNYEAIRQKRIIIRLAYRVRVTVLMNSGARRRPCSGPWERSTATTLQRSRGSAGRGRDELLMKASAQRSELCGRRCCDDGR